MAKLIGIILLVIASLSGIAIFVFWALATWNSDPELQQRLGMTAIISFFAAIVFGFPGGIIYGGESNG